MAETLLHYSTNHGAEIHTFKRKASSAREVWLAAERMIINLIEERLIDTSDLLLFSTYKQLKLFIIVAYGGGGACGRS